ncbi:hypothetical protein ABZP36_014559 [Zizania latifolia]
MFLFNCTGNGKPPPPAGFVNVTCPGTPAVVRLDPRYNNTDARAIAGGCDYSAVPVVGVPGARLADYPQLLHGGYILEWKAPAGDCVACNASGGRCGYDADTEAFACICSDGSSRPASCDAKKSGHGNVILIVSLSIVASGLLVACIVVFFKCRRRMRGLSFLTAMDSGSSTDTANVEKLLKKYVKFLRHSRRRPRGRRQVPPPLQAQWRGVPERAYAEKASYTFFPLWVYDHLLEDGGVLQYAAASAAADDSGAAHGGGEEIARKMALIGLWCIQTVPANRPSMGKVLEMLERSVHELAMPPRPYHTSPLNSPSPSRPSSYPSSASDFTLRNSRGEVVFVSTPVTRLCEDVHPIQLRPSGEESDGDYCRDTGSEEMSDLERDSCPGMDAFSVHDTCESSTSEASSDDGESRSSHEQLILPTSENLLLTRHAHKNSVSLSLA